MKFFFLSLLFSTSLFASEVILVQKKVSLFFPLNDSTLSVRLVGTDREYVTFLTVEELARHTLQKHTKLGVPGIFIAHNEVANATFHIKVTEERRIDENQNVCLVDLVEKVSVSVERQLFSSEVRTSLPSRETSLCR